MPKSIDKKPIVSKIEVVAASSKVIENNSPGKQQKVQSPKKNEPAKLNNIVSSKVEIKQGSQQSATPKLSSVVEVKSNKEEPAVLITNNNIGDPEYDFLSRQPSEFVEETYKVINLRPSKAHSQKPKHGHKNRVHQPTPQPNNDDDEHPVGLVTTLGGTVVKDGVTTIHETSVIGTYISGKYAQVLNSHSKVIHPSGHKPKIAPSPTLRILKTAAPAIAKNHRHNLEPTPAGSIQEETVLSHDNGFGKSSRRPAGTGSFKNRHRNHNNADDEHENVSGQSNKKFKNRNSSQSHRSQR